MVGPQSQIPIIWKSIILLQPELKKRYKVSMFLWEQNLQKEQNPKLFRQHYKGMYRRM